MTDGLLTVEQAAEFCQVSPSTIRRAIRHDGLVAVRIAGRGTVRIRRADLDAWLDAKAHAAPKVPSRPSEPVRVPIGTLGIPRTRRGSESGRLVLPRS